MGIEGCTHMLRWEHRGRLYECFVRSYDTSAIIYDSLVLAGYYPEIWMGTVCVRPAPDRAR